MNFGLQSVFKTFKTFFLWLSDPLGQFHDCILQPYQVVGWIIKSIKLRYMNKPKFVSFSQAVLYFATRLNLCRPTWKINAFRGLRFILNLHFCYFSQFTSLTTVNSPIW